MTSPCNTKVDVNKAPSGSSLIGNQERCWLDPTLASGCGVQVGDQVRFRRTASEYALYTVEQLVNQPTNDDAVMSADGRAKLGTTNTMKDIDLFAPADSVQHDKTEAWLSQNDEYGEFLDETNSTHTAAVVTAPHGGNIESHTDEQAEACHSRLVNTHSKDSSCWRAKGFRSGGGAFDRWHITSTDIARRTFTLLDQIGDRGFAYAVSFHGFSGSNEIKIGGGASDSLKNSLKSALDTALTGQGVTVTVLGAGQPLNGDDPANFVNWLTANGDTGLQLEQTLDVRADHGTLVAETVADFLATLV